MTAFSIDLNGTRHRFDTLGHLLACASAPKSGDALAGIAAQTAEQRVAARYLLADVPLKAFLNDLVIPYEHDEVSRLIIDQHAPEAFAPISHLTVGGFREWLLEHSTSTRELTSIAAGLTPEMVAATSKIMRNQDLIAVAAKTEVRSALRNSIGQKGRLSVRLQPNHPTDDSRGIAASIIDGLLLGAGDACIGINPATDNIENTQRLLLILDELIERFGIPTQSCVLTHVTNTIELINMGAPVDLTFQSIAGTEMTNRSFGFDLELLAQAQEATLSLGRGTVGNNVMYFETGQGSCLSAEGHHGVDQQTLECRAYAVARQFSPLLVNTVVGFIGPEYLFDGRQITRAGLEDHCCGKLLGLPMGVDVCYTNHADADQDDMDVLLSLLGMAGSNFIIGVPGADDVMLNYQSTSFHDALYVRELLGLQPAPEFQGWLEAQGIFSRDGRLLEDGMHRARRNFLEGALPHG